jgi:undecaprenyl diphosphate synthase
VAIIMDGNGRWAQKQGRGRIRGHREGADRVDEIVTECRRLGVKYLTLYAFSTENWARPKHEVHVLMQLLVQYLRRMDRKLYMNQVALIVQGNPEDLPGFVRRELDRVIRYTAKIKPKMYLNLCLSYGGRKEIVDAAKAMARAIEEGRLDRNAIDERVFSCFLYRPDLPDPDLLIRTGGEYRISNFLLWEIAYSEIYVTPVFWPDFRVLDLHEAFQDYASRERRFGKTSAQIAEEMTKPRDPVATTHSPRKRVSVS